MVHLTCGLKVRCGPGYALAAVLDAEANRFPDDPAIHYTVAGLAALQGNLDVARARLDLALSQQPSGREAAKQDGSFAALHAEL